MHYIFSLRVLGGTPARWLGLMVGYCIKMKLNVMITLIPLMVKLIELRFVLFCFV